ncbi:AsmA family protein, partial [Neisseria sp. P0013.S004]
GRAKFSLNTWEGRLKGAFDRQALALAFKYRRDAQPRPHFDAGIALQKLDLTPYLEDLKTQPSLNLLFLLVEFWLFGVGVGFWVGGVWVVGL